jgi:uncharacterized repeat protein (TIGR01451 family)
MKINRCWALYFALLTFVYLGEARAQGLPWSCDGVFYQVRAAAGQPSTLFSLINPSDNSAFQVTTLYTLTGTSVTPSTSTFVNGLGYRKTDNYLYALHRGAVGGTDAPNNTMYRIGRSSAVSLGVVTGLPANYSPTAADFDDLGFYYVLVAGGASVMYKIDVNTTPPSVVSTITLSTAVPNVGDMSYIAVPGAPGTGSFYGLTSGASGVRITLGGTVSTLAFTGLPAGAGWGTTWADASGYFYGYDNFATGGTAVYRINLATGAAITDSPGPTISGSDGAQCVNFATTGSITGTVFIDNNNNGVLNAGELGLVLPATTLTVYAIDGFGKVAGKATISPTTGVYTMTGLYQSSNYQLVLSNSNAIAIGATAPAASLPAGFINTGESLNAVADGTVDGRNPGFSTPISGGVSGLNFGVRASDMLPVFSGFPATATAGSTVTGVITCTNAAGGLAALAATCGVTPTSPAGLIVTVGTCTPPSPVASLAVGATITCSVSVQVPVATSFTITGVTGAQNDGNGGTGTGGNNSTVLAIPITPGVDLSITKSNVVTALATGATTTYTLVIRNGGPSAADGTVVKDPAVAGLSCTTVSCPAASIVNGAVCPAAASLTIVNLQSAAGITVPTLPANSSLSLLVTCTVSATGL